MYWSDFFKLLSSILGTIFGCVLDTLTLICNEYDHLSFYNSNIEKMKKETEKLADVRASVEVAVEAAERNLDRIRIDVTLWMEQADDILKRVSEYDNVWCIDGLCPNLMEHYSWSKWAAKEIQDVAKLRRKGQFTTVSYRPDQAIDTTSSEGLNSRIQLSLEIMEALKDDRVELVGLCGLGGVGKTTMAQEIRHKAEQKDELRFDEVVFVDVPRASDTRIVQQSIADCLGLQLEENDDLFRRASALRKRLKLHGHVLLILDDVWMRLDLNELGVPFETGEENRRCKVFFTSSNLDACYQMNPQKVFKIVELPPDEAWNLFQQELKESFAPDHDLYQVATDIVKRCGGLPLGIVTIAQLLRGENHKDTWQAILKRLESGDLDDQYSTVYKILAESYKFIESDETKCVFLLCCLFPEAEEIAIEDLLRFGIGLNIFEKSNTVDSARIKTYSCVNKLKNKHLLDGGSVKGFVKMRNLVRDTGLNIASTGKNVYVVRHGDDLVRWPEEPKPECCTSISLRCHEMLQLPGGLRYPRLELLQLIGFYRPLMFPTNFFEGMGELKVLNLKQMLIQSYPFEVLEKLRSLSLDFCTFPIGVSSLIGNLGALTVLSFAYSDIQILPQAIGKLTLLRVLDLTECSELHTIAPGVLDSLIRLEELCMSGCYNLNIECLRELSSLSHLAALEIEGQSTSCVLPYINYGKLTRFWICVGHAMDSKVFENTLKLSDITFREEQIEVLFSKAEILHLICCRFATRRCLNKSEAEDFSKLRALNLDYCHGLVHLVQRYEQEPSNVFQTLESLFLCDMRNLEGMLGFKQGEIRELNGSVLLPSFQNLRDLEIWHCPRLKRLFWISKGLMKLEKLKIVSCNSMEAIFWIQGRGEEEESVVMNFEFPELKCLFLVDLPHVTDICKGVHSVMFPRLIEVRLTNVPNLTIPHLKLAYSNQRFLDEKIVLTSQLEDLSVGSMHLKGVQVDEHLDRGVLNLRHMTLNNCDGLAIVASSHVIQKLMFLEVIQICGCPIVEVVFDLEGVIVEEAPTVAVMNNLTKLQLAYLPRMTHVWKHVPKGFEGFKKLTMISLEDCDSLGPSLFSLLIVNLLVQLRHLWIRRCDYMEVIVNEDDEADPVATVLPHKLEFPSLISLRLEELRILRCFCSKPHDFVWPLLESVEIINCPQLTTFTVGKSFTPSLRNINFDLVDLNAAVEDHIKQSPGVAFTSRKSTPIFPTSSEGLNSRKRLRLELIEVLKDDNVQLVGLCGLGGVGKTTMAREIWQKANQKDELHFDKLVFVAVTRASDATSVQQRIADCLGLQLEENDDFSRRASALRARLKLCDHVLLILDDVWEQLDLKELGIPSEASEENKRCKVFFTSRNSDVCKQMKPQKVFDINELPPDEAWNLFVQESKESFAPDHDLYQVARDIVERCKGLPLSIVTIAKRLHGENDKDTWQDILEHLKSGDLDDGEYSTVYTVLGECYNNIRSDETKRVFLLCCLFPEDEEIAIEDLLRLGIGLNIFEKSNTVNSLRIRTYSCVNKLKNRQLLDGGSVKGFVKIHDLVRDTGLNIASTGENVFVVRHGDDLLRWPEEPKPEYCTSISLRCHEMLQLPGGLRYPRLELLQLIGFYLPLMFPTNFFDGMGELKVLNLKQMLIRSYPFEVSKKLQSLSLDLCRFPTGVPSSIGNLEALMILSFAGSDVKILPQEIGKLTQLRVLDLTSCRGLRTIAPRVLQNLKYLEEFYIRGCYLLNMECLRELSSLSHLAALDIDGRSGDFPLPYIDYGKLMRFRICVWDPNSLWNYTKVFENTLHLFGETFREDQNTAFQITKKQGMEVLFSRAETLQLSNCCFETHPCLNKSEADNFSKLSVLALHCCRGLEHLVQSYEQEPSNMFQSLESLRLDDMCDLEDIFGFKCGEIREPNRPVPRPSFQNLRDLVIWSCARLKRLFPISQGLMKLEKLNIVDCVSMETIFWIERRGEEEEESAVMNVEFPELKQLILKHLPSLNEFCEGVHSLMPSLQNLGDLEIRNCSRLKKLFRISEGFMKLQKLKIVNCDSLETVFWIERRGEEEEENAVINVEFPELKQLILNDLPLLTEFCEGVHWVMPSLQNLRDVEVRNCPRLKKLFRISEGCMKLQKLEIVNCDSMETIFWTERIGEEEEGNAVMNVEFPELKCLELSSLWLLSEICKGVCSVMLPWLIELRLHNVPELTILNGTIVLTSQLEDLTLEGMHLKGVQIDEHLDRGVLNLRRMCLTRCNGLAIVASSHVIQKLLSLEVIKIYWCHAVEVVFDLEGMMVEEAPRVVVMDSLTELELYSLPRMTHVWKHVPKGFEGFHNLSDISVDICNSLGPSLFSPLIVKLLVQLRVLRVDRCDKLEVIVKGDDEADPVETELPHKLEFPSLRDLQLGRLRILRCFYSEPRDLVWPSLKYVVIKDCPQLTTFTVGKSFTPSLRNIVDLNAAVENHIKQSPGIEFSS